MGGSWEEKGKKLASFNAHWPLNPFSVSQAGLPTQPAEKIPMLAGSKQNSYYAL